jgi:hypothetical protein
MEPAAYTLEHATSRSGHKGEKDGELQMGSMIFGGARPRNCHDGGTSRAFGHVSEVEPLERETSPTPRLQELTGT